MIAMPSAGPTPWVPISAGTSRARRGSESEQRLVVFADVMVDVEEHRRAGFEFGERPARHGDDVADTADLEQHRTVDVAFEDRPRSEPIIARSGAARRDARRLSGAIAR